MTFGGHRTTALIGEGGFAQVFRATSPTGSAVALKVAHPSDVEPDALPRMRREIEVQSTLDHPNVMPIISADPSEGWFTMPLAEGNLDDLISRGAVRTAGTDLVFDVVLALLEGLAPAHELGLVHRDVNPGNSLGIRDGDGLRWLVADWGIVRRRAGATTYPRTANAGNRIGTLGYAAPELWSAAHDAEPSADVYSVARVAARLITDRIPVMNVPLRPTGVWRPWIDECTHDDPKRRPQSAADAKARLKQILAVPVGGALTLLATGVDAARKTGVSDETWRLAVQQREDLAALKIVVTVQQEEVQVWAQREPDDALALSTSVCAEVLSGWGRESRFEDYDLPLRWLLSVLRAFAYAGHVDHLQDLATAYFAVEQRADRWRIRAETARWIGTLEGPVDAPVAWALHTTALGSRYADDVGHSVSSRTIKAALGL